MFLFDIIRYAKEARVGDRASHHHLVGQLTKHYHACTPSVGGIALAFDENVADTLMETEEANDVEDTPFNDENDEEEQDEVDDPYTVVKHYVSKPVYRVEKHYYTTTVRSGNNCHNLSFA